jgi:hypothetical protein
MKPFSKTLICFVVIVLLAYAIRLYALDAVPLRGDEAYTVMHWTAPPLSDRWLVLIQDEPAPYGAFTVYWAWHGLTGASEFAIRYLSVLGNVIGVAACMALTRRLFHNWRLALLAGILWAVHANLIWHAQDARVYGVLSASVTLTFYALIRALDQPASFRHWWPYIGLQTFSLTLYYLEPLWMVAQLLIVGIGFRRAWWPFVRAWVVIGLLWLPVGAQLYHLMFVSQYQGNAEAGQLSLFLTDFAPTLLFGDSVVPLWVGGVLVGAVIAGFVLLARQPSMRKAALILACWVFIPLVLLYGASFVSDFFRPRYVMAVIPALMIAIVGVASVLGRYSGLASWVFVGLFLVVNVGQIYAYFFTLPPKAPDWYGLTNYLDIRMSEQDIILSDSRDPALEYYYKGAGEVVFMPLNTPMSDYLPDLLEQRHAIFVLSGQNTGEITTYLSQHAQHITGDTWAGVVQYRRWRVEPDEIVIPLAVTMGDVATLQGYTLLGNTQILLYWQADSTTEIDYSILLHLEDANGQVIALDHAPAASIVSTRTWTPNTLYRDPVAFPPEIASGTYRLYVGMYPAGQPENLVEGRLFVGDIEID